ncbi:Fic family protein [uncultured Jannaschia sp.]|uniref:Fic family protein n=1 Tax=uncultured Jannaschia sp. TaxID=293347 RepID=UPI002601980C|nr:Fic family protein [uncultured Jannaschia sp.]
MPRQAGHYVETITGGETVRAFVPAPLPPVPPIEAGALLRLLNDAQRALGRLDGVTMLLPSQELFLYMYVRKEAVLSSQIEGTQSTLTDLLLFEENAKAGVPVDDVREVSNYVDAMMHGLARLEELPLSLRLIREMHARLLDSGRGATKDPGAFRRSQNWIGGTRPGNALYVPPPVDAMEDCLRDLEAFIHEDASDLPPLIKAGLIHVQFESIHPFLDGNGRIGRLLVTLYLCVFDGMEHPLLYLSLYLKENRASYYRLLQEVRESGAWEAWLEFFLLGVTETANQAFDAARRIAALFEADRTRIAEGGAASHSALRVHELMQRNPFAAAPRLVRETGLTTPTVNAALRELERLEIVEEITGKARGRVYAYAAYMRILGEGTGSRTEGQPAR